MESNIRTGQIAAGLASITTAVWEIVHEARAVEPKTDEPIVDELRSGIVELGRAAQALHGHLMVMLAEGNRLSIAAGGVGPWLASVLDFTQGRAGSCRRCAQAQRDAGVGGGVVLRAHR